MNRSLETSSAPGLPAMPALGDGPFRALVQNSWDILSILDEQGRLVYNSPAGQRIHGFESSEFLGKNTFSFIHPDDQAVVSATLEKILAAPGVPHTVIYRYAHKGGGWTWMEAVAVNFLDDPEVRGIVTNSRDISEQHCSEEALQRSKALLAQAQALAGIGSFEVDLALQETLWSDGMYGFFDRDSALGPPTWEELLELVHVEDRRVFHDSAAQARKTGEPFEFSFRVADRTGRMRHLAVKAQVQLDPSGKPSHLIGAVQDITERIESEQALRESLDRFKQLADFLPQSVFEVDLTGRLTFVNRWAMDTFGYGEEEVARGLNNLDMLVPEDRERAVKAMQDTLAGKGTGREFRGLRKDGTTFPIVIHSTPILRDDRPVGLRGVIFDLTELKAGELERDRLKERIRHSEKMEAVGQLAGGVAHDFNNQLSAIMGFADLLAEGEQDPVLHEYAENIAKSCARSAELTKQLLAFARRGKYLSVPVDLAALVLEVVQLLRRSLDKRITIDLDLPQAGCLTLGDPSQLQNALMNLALNARDAMPQGGSLVFSIERVEFGGVPGQEKISELTPGRYLKVSVQDTGDGMAPELVQRIFEPFFTTKERGKGTGLGLASVYGTVQSHKGSVTVQSTPGQGSCFSLFLPQLDANTSNELAEQPEVVLTTEKRVLVIEDEPLVGEMLVAMLQRLGFQVEFALDGLRGLEIYKEDWRKIDLVILDLVMPRMSGLETFLALKAVNPSVRVLLSSGYSVDGEAQQVLNQGAIGFLQKPYQSRELQRHLMKAFEET